jgi:hypothetical protein
MKAAPGKRDELKSELEALIKPTAAENGCVTTTCTKESKIRTFSSSTRTGNLPQRSTHTWPRPTSSTSPTSRAGCSTTTG